MGDLTPFVTDCPDEDFKLDRLLRPLKDLRRRFTEITQFDNHLLQREGMARQLTREVAGVGHPACIQRITGKGHHRLLNITLQALQQHFAIAFATDLVGGIPQRQHSSYPDLVFAEHRRRLSAQQFAVEFDLLWFTKCIEIG